MSTRPRLLILAFSPLRADARVLRQVRLLSGRYEVTTCGYGPAPDGVEHHVRVPDELVYWHKSRPLLVARRFRQVHERNAVERMLRSTLPRGHFEVVLANDVETVPLARWLRPRGGVHADIHEYAPRQNEQSWRWRVFVAPYQRWLCREHLTRADSVTTVGEGLAAEYCREFGIDATVVLNAAAGADLDPTPTGQTLALVHSGIARRNRALHLMLDAVQQTTRPVTLDLYLVPNDPGYLVELTERAAVIPGVTVHDPVAPAELPQTLHSYDVGLFVVPPSTFNLHWVMPNKFFDYVQARLGIIVGPSPEMAGMVEKHRLGAVMSGFEAEELAAVLDATTPADVDRWKACAHAVAPGYAADRQTHGWSNAVDALAARAEPDTQ